MAVNDSPIKYPIDDTEFDGATLDMLRDTLSKNNPELLKHAAAELSSAKKRLDNLIDVIDRNLVALDKSWTEGEDAKTVKAQLRRLKESAESISKAIATEAGGQPHGVAPALVSQALVLTAMSGKSVPKDPGSDISFLEAAFEGGAAGTAVGAGVGFFAGGVGAVPGAVIGAVTGTIVGGITSLFSDTPFANLFGESKEEKERKLAKQHIDKLSEITKINNELFPVSLRTDTPEFSIGPTVPDLTPTNAKLPNGGGLPGGPSLGIDPDKLNGIDPNLNGDLNAGKPGELPGHNPFDPASKLPGDGNLSGSGLPGANGFDPNGSYGSGIGSGTGSGTGDGNGTGGKTPDGKIPGAPDLDPGALTAPSTPETTLAAYNPELSAYNNTNGNPSTTYGNANVGTNGPGAGAGAGAGAGGAAGAVGAARAYGSAGSMVPAMPMSAAGNKDEQEERERTTWLYEDDDLFSSEERTTIPLINDKSKGRA
ncbi:WXG100 family type VII secretion target [Nonomuraea sp. NPDC050790]|uniref:WXG100 family type VII secretion target n=1 Tax=Nonomuraea sp. NPDC050790 TaxID=3364371 RepID=UPI0037A9B0DA